MKMNASLCLCPLCAGLLLCCSALDATTIERLPLARMVQAARIIVRARCVSNSTAWASGEIWTFTIFNVEEAWKGERSEEVPAMITIRLLGGAAGALTSHVSGVPRFSPGEDAVIFLEPVSPGDFSVLGWAEGTFRIVRDPRTGEKIVLQDTAAFATFNPKTRRFETEGLRNVPLAAFRERVHSALAATGERK